jgi:hypothetical protein
MTVRPQQQRSSSSQDGRQAGQRAQIGRQHRVSLIAISTAQIYR